MCPTFPVNTKSHTTKDNTKNPHPIRHKSWAKRISLTFFVAALVLISGLLIGANNFLAKITNIYTLDPFDSPFPLHQINETRLHIIVEGTPENNNYLGLELRQASFHMPLGMLGETQFQNGFYPEQNISDISLWDPSILVDWETALNNTRVNTIHSLADSPIHSGEYLQGEALRWAVYNRENNQDGLNAACLQISRVLDGFWFVTHATGTPGRLVRQAVPNNTIGYSFRYDPNDPYDYYYGGYCPEKVVHTRWGDFLSPSFNFSSWVLKGDTSRDQHIGVLMGLASVIKYVQNTTLLMKAGAIAIELVETLMNNGWKTIEPLPDTPEETHTNGADMDPGPFNTHVLPLSFLKLASQVDPVRFIPEFEKELIGFNQLTQLHNDNGRNNVFPAFYPANLDWESIWSWWIFEEDPLVRKNILPLLEHEYETIASFKNAFFQILYLSLNPEDNPSSAAANETRRTRIVAEITDTLARKADDLWDGGPNYYRIANLTEIGINISDSHELEQLYDPDVKEILNSMPEFASKILSDVVGWEFEDYQSRIMWALPANCRPPEDWMWQRTPYRLRSFTWGNLNQESYHADTTTIYWWARWNNWISSPNASLNISISSITNEQIFTYFGGTSRGLPSNYANSVDLIQIFKGVSV